MELELERTQVIKHVDRTPMERARKTGHAPIVQLSTVLINERRYCGPKAT